MSELTPAPCIQCGYVFYEEIELSKEFVYVDGEAHCLQCLRENILFSYTVKNAGTAIAIMNEE